MRKVLSILICIILLPYTIATANTDYTTMTDDELKQVVSLVRNELVKRSLVNDDKVIVFDQDNVSMYLTGGYKEWNYKDKYYVDIEMVIINNTDHKVTFIAQQSSVNGWDTESSTPGPVSAGKKKKDRMVFSLSDAEITSYKEIEDIDVKFRVCDADTYDNLYITDLITIHFTH